MDTFLITATYLPRYWGKVLANPADRVATISETMEALGGRLVSAYWEVLTSSAWILVELPDSICATAYLSAVLKTGAFTSGEVHELLTEEQFLDVASVAQSLEGIFRPPGSITDLVTTGRTLASSPPRPPARIDADSLRARLYEDMGRTSFVSARHLPGPSSYRIKPGLIYADSGACRLP